MSKLLHRVGIVRGGTSSEYEISLNSGSAVIQTIRDHLGHQYSAHDIFIDRNGRWYIDGDAIQVRDLHSKIDLAFNALHGEFGEDGKIQSLFESHGIPFTGSGSVGSAMGMNKIISKKMFKDHGIKTPRWIEIKSEDIENNLDTITNNLFETFILPGVVKPASAGSSVGVSVIRNYHEFPVALAKAAAHGPSVIVEEYIQGPEATVSVIEVFRTKNLYALPPVEIRHGASFFDYAVKYGGKPTAIVPASFPEATKKALEETASQVHRAFGLRHYSHTDFIIHPKKGIYVLEVNTTPKFFNDSPVAKSLRAVGSDLHELVGHLLGLAYKNN